MAEATEEAEFLWIEAELLDPDAPKDNLRASCRKGVRIVGGNVERCARPVVVVVEPPVDGARFEHDGGVTARGIADAPGLRLVSVSCCRPVSRYLKSVNSSYVDRGKSYTKGKPRDLGCMYRILSLTVLGD